jgi:hypothetical protein
VMRSDIVFRIVSSDAFLSILSSIGMIDLASKSFERTRETNRERSPRMIPRPFGEGK